ncbi:MAG TPA: hypothetical protein VFM64_01645 [Candidatus Nitrosotenuis sp.]|nr:hypothetical protein [Candidatus Nitrosotenuis sp.]
MKFSLIEYLRTMILGIGAVSISHVLVTIFGQTIPNAVTGFFREVGGVLMLVLVFAFAFSWFLRARPRNKPKKYSIVIFDVFGQQIDIDGLRTDFKNHDVAWSFMKMYKNDYPSHNFAMVAEGKNTPKKTIFKYI